MNNAFTPYDGIDLLPCPFCGGEPRLYTDGITVILCTGCGLAVSNSQRSSLKLKDQWNTRKLTNE